jgi:hypothetical protein
MRRYAIPLAGLAVLGAAACSPDKGDFKNDAQGFIEDDDGEVEKQIGVALSDATCDDPASTDVGTTFACTAVGDDGTTYDFTVEITGDNSYQVGGGTASSGSAPPGTGGATSVPATTTG